MGVLSRSMEQQGAVPTDGGDPSERQKMWRSQRVAELSSGIAHEVRNPLNAMAIHLEVLSDKLRDQQGELPSALRPNLEAIRGQIRRLDGIIRQFSDFAQGRAPSRELADIVEEAMSLCSFPMRRRGVEVELSSIPVATVSDGASISLAFIETFLCGVEAAEIGAKVGIFVEPTNENIRIRFELDTQGSEFDERRLEMVGAHLKELGGKLESGAQPGTFAVLTIPVETRSTN